MIFSASELCIERGLNSNTMAFFDDHLPQEKGIGTTEIISGVLHTGFCRDGKELDGYTRFQMIGTNRKIERISLIIEPIDEGETEGCRLSGSVAYTSDTFSQDEYEADFLEIRFHVKRERFDMLAKSIKTESDLDDFRKMLTKVTVETALNAELDSNLWTTRY